MPGDAVEQRPGFARGPVCWQPLRREQAGWRGAALRLRGAHRLSPELLEENMVERITEEEITEIVGGQ